jgi:hypothetical protein
MTTNPSSIHYSVTCQANGYVGMGEDRVFLMSDEQLEFTLEILLQLAAYVART